jgi:hypothetical protein
MLDHPPVIDLYSSTFATIDHGEALAVDLDREPDHRLVGSKERDVVNHEAGRVVAGTGDTFLRLAQRSGKVPTALHVHKCHPVIVRLAKMVESVINRFSGSGLVLRGIADRYVLRLPLLQLRLCCRFVVGPHPAVEDLLERLRVLSVDATELDSAHLCHPDQLAYPTNHYAIWGGHKPEVELGQRRIDPHLLELGDRPWLIVQEPYMAQQDPHDRVNPKQVVTAASSWVPGPRARRGHVHRCRPKPPSPSFRPWGACVAGDRNDPQHE